MQLCNNISVITECGHWTSTNFGMASKIADCRFWTHEDRIYDFFYPSLDFELGIVDNSQSPHDCYNKISVISRYGPAFR